MEAGPVKPRPNQNPSKLRMKPARSSLVAHWIKDQALSLQRFGFDPWPRNLDVSQARPPKKVFVFY